jgi:hypothetical protein
VHITDWRLERSWMHLGMGMGMGMGVGWVGGCEAGGAK